MALSRPSIGTEEREAVDSVLASGALAQGAEVQQFEEAFAAAIGVREAVALNSGTSALHLMLLALHLQPGDEVIVPSFSFAATANAVALAGGHPVFADIEPGSFCLTPDSIARAASTRTRAVMPVHLYGYPADMESISNLCAQEEWHLVEDSAQAHLAEASGKKVGSWGIAGAFSFYPTKNMTTGEGGAVTTNDAEIARKVRLLRNQGMERRYENEVVGLNNRMTNISAAIGLVQLRKLESWTKKRVENAMFLNSGLEQITSVTIPSLPANGRHVFHQYTVRVPEKDREPLIEFLKARNIDSGVYYPYPIHTLKPFRSEQTSLPETEKAAKEVLSLPVNPHLTETELHRVIAGVQAYFEIQRSQ